MSEFTWKYTEGDSWHYGFIGEEQALMVGRSGDTEQYVFYCNVNGGSYAAPPVGDLETTKAEAIKFYDLHKQFQVYACPRCGESHHYYEMQANDFECTECGLIMGQYRDAEANPLTEEQIKTMQAQYMEAPAETGQEV